MPRHLKTRKPTGLPAWPILLIAGVEKAGKTYAAAAASSSDLIGRTLWVSIGEDDPDEYGAIPGARFEIVEHDGTYLSILGTLDAIVKETKGDEKPALIVLDSATRLWNLLSDEAQAVANQRAAKKGRRTDTDAPIAMDLWNLAKSRWDNVMDTLREHQGPSIVTARLDLTAVVNDKGDPTKDKTWKVQAHKSLPFDVGAIVELPAPGEAVLTGVRSLRVKDAQVGRRPLKKWTVDGLWREMGLADETGSRSHTASSGADSAGAEERMDAARNRLLHEIGEAAEAAGVDRQQIAADWLKQHGHPIAQTTDLKSLEQMRDDLRTPKEQQ